jgi:hypothetical protein
MRQIGVPINAEVADHGGRHADGSTDGFYRSRRGRFRIIEAPGEATYTRALDINDHGDIVGDYDTEPPSTGDNSSSHRRLMPGNNAAPVDDTTHQLWQTRRAMWSSPPGEAGSA